MDITPQSHPDLFELVAIGDELQPTDLYQSTSGRWERCPCPGVANGGAGIFYRAIKEQSK